MSDVIARVLRSLSPALAPVDCDLDDLLVEHGLSPRYLWMAPATRIPWNLFSEILQDAGARLGGPNKLEAVGAQNVLGMWRTLLSVAVAQVTPMAAFGIGVHYFAPSIFKGISANLFEIPGGLGETVVIPKDRNDSVEFFWLSCGVMGAFSLAIGWEVKSIGFSHYDHRAEFRIQLSPREETEPRDATQTVLRSPQADDEELASLGFPRCEPTEFLIGRFGHQNSLSERVRSYLVSQENWSSITAEAVARSFYLSERNFARRLASEATSFRELRDEARTATAISRIQSGQSIEEVAISLGYADPSSFYRSFRRCTGRHPASYRPGSNRGVESV